MTSFVHGHSFSYSCSYTKEKTDLRTLLKKKQEQHETVRLRRLAGKDKPNSPKKLKNGNYREWVTVRGFPITVFNGSGMTVSSGISYSEAEMNEVRDKLKDSESKLLSAEDEIACLTKRLEETENALANVESELNEFKTVSAFFLADFVTDVDNIMPDDLEYGLKHFEKRIEELASFFRDSKVLDSNSSWTMVYDLCKELGMQSVNGYTCGQNARLFIKELARTKFELEKENAQLAAEYEMSEEGALGLIETLLKIKRNG